MRYNQEQNILLIFQINTGTASVIFMGSVRNGQFEPYHLYKLANKRFESRSSTMIAT
jgi:hypothetical protein